MVTRAIALLSERLLGIHKPKSLSPLVFFRNQNGKKNFKGHHSENSHHWHRGQHRLKEGLWGLEICLGHQDFKWLPTRLKKLENNQKVFEKPLSFNTT